MDRGSGSSLTTDKKIVEDLTKDLETSFPRSQSVETNVNDKHDCKTRDPEENPPRDFVDEELLKDREIDLTESERQYLGDTTEKLKNQGNELFKTGKYEEAISAYTEGLRTCPLAYNEKRSILYANRAAAKAKCLEKESAIADCTKAIELNPNYRKVIVRRALLYKETDKLNEALEDLKLLNSMDPNNVEWQEEIRSLDQSIKKRNEELTAEVLTKFKDLGNMVLKPFGLSTNNFQFEKDANSGGYSVKFNQDQS